MIRTILALLALLATSPALAAPITPGWDSDRIRAARPTAPVPAVVLAYRREIGGARTFKAGGTITLAADFVAMTDGAQNEVTDFAQCRSLQWRTGEGAVAHANCYADPGFRLSELANRRYLARVLATAMAGKPAPAGFDQPFWAEQELAVQDAPSDPLTMTRTATGTEWRLGGIVAVRTEGAIAFSAAERPAVARFLARYIGLHPQVRRAILAGGSLPERMTIERRMPAGAAETETILFSGVERRPVAYPLPPHLASELDARAKGKTTGGAALRQALAVADGAGPPRPTLDAMIARFEQAAAAGHSLEAYLAFTALALQHGPALQSDPTLLPKLRALGPAFGAVQATPEVAPLARAFDAAGSGGADRREAAARYLAGASGIDALPFGTFRYLTFANLIAATPGDAAWVADVTKRMPPLADCYWRHIAANPWASPPYKDLGDYWFRHYDAVKAWEAWDIGRAVDPAWRGGPIKAVADFEDRLRRDAPDFF